jgi:hypothetical protein
MPHVEIDDNGVCNFCKRSAPANPSDRNKQKKILESLFYKAKKEAWPYQVLVAYSGGKDSSYLLYHLKNEYKLNVLAFSVIHPFMREDTQDTMDVITKNIGVDLVKFRPQEDIIRSVIRQGMLTPEQYGHRHSVGCSLCGAFHHLIPFVFATKMGIPIVATGSDPAQSAGYPPLSLPNAKVKFQLAFAKFAAMVTGNRLPKRFKFPFLPDTLLSDVHGDQLSNSIYKINEFEMFKQLRLPKLISPLSIIDYDYREKAKKMEQLGIVNQEKTHSLLSNCTLHHFFAYLSYKRYDCHPYEDNFSEALRQSYPTFIEQFARKGYQTQNPREDTLKFLKDYKAALALIVKRKNTALTDTVTIVKKDCRYLYDLLGEGLLTQAVKDISLIHHWAKYFEVDLERL